MKECIDSETKTLGLYKNKKILILTIFKDAQNKFYKTSVFGSEYSDIVKGTRRAVFPCCMNPKPIPADKIVSSIANQLGFPNEQQLQNNEFVPGSFYHALDNKESDEKDVKDV